MTLPLPLPASQNPAPIPSACARAAIVGLLLVAGVIGTACAPLVVGGAMVGGALMVSDRRTAGTQVEDQSIELKAASRIRQAVGDRGHINVTSYNRSVLITGEAATEADKSAIEQAVRSVENVRAVLNELAVMGASSMTSRSNDTLVSARVKAAFVDAKDVQANAVKVVSERGVVYLMGRVTEREAARASEVARAVNGVLKVVRVFDLITEADLAAMTNSGRPPTGTTNPAPSAPR